MQRAMTKQRRSTGYLLKVSLRGAPGIWRRIAIRGDQTLDDLHTTIFHAFDRFDEHLYSFYFPKAGSRGKRERRMADEYTHPAAVEDSNDFGSKARNAAKTTIDSLHLRPRQRFDYLFDFGDSWEHEVLVEEVDVPLAAGRYPRITERHGASPPQYPNADDE